MDDSKMVSLYDAAEILNVHYNTLRRWIYMKKVKAVKIGRAWKLSTEELDRIKSEGVSL